MSVVFENASPFIASAGDLVYLWGGWRDAVAETVFLFQRDTKTWARQRTIGPHPPARLRNGGCCISGQHLYIYGGWDGKSCHGVLYELNTNSWTWKKLCDGGAGGPGKKRGCRMIPYHQDELLVVGGLYDEMPSPRQVGSSYENHRTNEVHCFNLTSGLWSSPSMKGSRPLPCSEFSLTVIDKDEAVMFGGYSTPSGESSDTHILYLPTMTWTKYKERHPWPKKRCDHIATCLGYGGEYKTILIYGGCDGYITHGDMWLLDLLSGRTEKLRVPSKYKKLIQRYDCGAATFTVNSDSVEVILFGGYDKYDSSLPGTTVFTFEWQNNIEGGRWALVDIADDTQLGSQARLATERRFMESSHTKGNMDGNVSLEQELQDARIREEQLQRRAEDAERRAEYLEGRAEAAEERVHNLERSLADTTQNLRQYKMMTEEIESELLKEYPQLPVARQNEVDTTITHSGFAVEKEISVAYKGEKSSIIWREGGILLKLKEDKDHRLQDATKCSVQRFSSEGSYSRLPSNSEVASQVYFINTSKPLKRNATIRIYHQAREVDIDQLCFLTSTDEQPPYDFNILKGGHFTSAYGEITVERFSFFTIVRFFKQHGFRGVLYYMEKSYEASLYHSKQPSSQGSQFKWNLYLSVTKNCHVFRSCLKHYIKEEFNEDVELVSKCIVKLNRTADSITASTSMGTSPPSQDHVCLYDPDTTSFQITDIRNYIDGCPPAFVYRLLAKPSSKFKVEFVMEGFERNCKFNLYQYHLQELCSSTPSRVSSLSSISSDNAGCTTSNLDLDQVLEEVFDAKAKWKFIGLKLGVPKGELDAIEYSNSSIGQKLMETLDKWLQSGRNTTWKALAEAMGAATVGCEDLKQNILTPS